MKHRIGRRAGLAGAVILSFAFIAPILATAGPAGAGNPPTPQSASIEICKTLLAIPTALNSMSSSYSFNFTVTSGSKVVGTASVASGDCSDPNNMVLPDGTYTVTEQAEPWYQVAPNGISVDTGFPALSTSNVAAQTATIVLQGTKDAEVRFTNQVVGGYIEICKAAAANSDAAGTYSFDVSGADGFTLSGTTAVTAQVGYCSGAVEVPAGTVTTTEAGTNLYVTGIAAQIDGSGPSAITLNTWNKPVLLDLNNGKVEVNVDPSADSSTQTDVTYTNGSTNVKVCKVWSNTNGPETLLAGGVTTEFPFTESASGPVGPNTAPGGFSLEASLTGVCGNPTAYRPGTVVTIAESESAVPGSKLWSIGTTGDETTEPGYPNLATATTQIIVGLPTSSTTSATGEATVTFTDAYADPGTLKICKTLGTPVPNASSFTLTVSGPVPGSGVFNFPTGAASGTTECGWLLTSSGSIAEIPFNAKETVSETNGTNDAVSGISSSPTYVTEYLGCNMGSAGCSPTLLSELVNAGATAVPNQSASQSVIIGEGTTTEVGFTDTDPPATTTVTPPITVPNPGIDTGVTTVFDSTPSGATAVANGTPNVFSTHVTQTLKPTKAQIRVELRKDNRLLSTVKSDIVKENKLLGQKLSKSARRADKARLAALKAEEKVLKLKIALLKK